LGSALRYPCAARALYALTRRTLPPLCPSRAAVDAVGWLPRCCLLFCPSPCLRFAAFTMFDDPVATRCGCRLRVEFPVYRAALNVNCLPHLFTQLPLPLVDDADALPLGLVHYLVWFLLPAPSCYVYGLVVVRLVGWRCCPHHSPRDVLRFGSSRCLVCGCTHERFVANTCYLTPAAVVGWRVGWLNDAIRHLFPFNAMASCADASTPRNGCHNTIGDTLPFRYGGCFLPRTTVCCWFTPRCYPRCLCHYLPGSFITFPCLIPGSPT
jgi:hypothetical protein